MQKTIKQRNVTSYQTNANFDNFPEGILYRHASFINLEAFATFLHIKKFEVNEAHVGLDLQCSLLLWRYLLHS